MNMKTHKLELSENAINEIIMALHNHYMLYGQENDDADVYMWNTEIDNIIDTIKRQIENGK